MLNLDQNLFFKIYLPLFIMNQIYRNEIVLKYLFAKALPYAQYSKFKVLWYAFE